MTDKPYAAEAARRIADAAVAPPMFRGATNSYWQGRYDGALAALSRPTQTADAVEAVKSLIEKHIRFEFADGERGHIVWYGEEKLAEELAALSTSDDSGDREEVEPSAGGTDADTFVQKLHRSPTPQDSGLADELEALTTAIITWFENHTGFHINQHSDDVDGTILQAHYGGSWVSFDAIKLAEYLSGALRQPRNDGELLREAHTALVECGCTNFDLIARLDQGEG